MEKLTSAFYDPNRSYQDNILDGPFGEGLKDEKYITEGTPKRSFLGNLVYLDLGISAGPLVNGKAVKRALDLGWDIVTYKTVRSEQYPVNGYPNLLPTRLDQMLNSEIAERGIMVARSFSFPSSPTNSFGVPSLPPDIWVPDATDAVQYAKYGQVVVVSLQGTPKGSHEMFVQDHVDAAKYAKKTGAKILCLNQSCPNEGTSHLLCLDPLMSGRTAEAVRNEIGDKTKLLAKICYFSDQDLLKRYIKSVGPFVDGIVAINTMAARIITEELKPAFGEGREKAGISGEYIRPYGLDMTRRIAGIAADFNFNISIIGVGGIFNKFHYLAYKEAGAAGCEMATGFLASPKAILDIKSGLGISTKKVVENLSGS